MRHAFYFPVLGSLLMSTAAFAADAVFYDPVPVPAAPSVFSWTGPYIGIHAGYAWGREHDNQSESFPGGDDSAEAPILLQADRFSVDGFIGGVHVGHNWQNDSFVYGIEGDFDFANVKGGADFAYDNVTGHLSLESDWQASIRARLGYAMDTWLFYATGGVAFGHADLTASNADLTFSDSNTHVGWTVGVGVEKAFTPNLIGRLEARYTDFGKKTYNLGDFGTNIRADWHQAAVTVGLSYKF